MGPAWGGELADALRETRDHPALAAAASRVEAAEDSLSAARRRSLGAGGVLV